MDSLPAIIHPSPSDMTAHVIGETANRIADRTAHHRYTKGKAYQTRRRQIADLQCFARYLATAKYPYDFTSFIAAVKRNTIKSAESEEDQQLEPLQWEIWQGVTHGLVEAFIGWQERQGYAIGSMNVRLATVKTYCALASRAGVIPQIELLAINAIKGASHREGRNIDQDRDIARLGKKKEAPTPVSAAHAVLLKRQRRAKDAAMMCLLLDLGLRCGELAALTVQNVNLEGATITFYREKVDETQTHRLTPDCLLALQRYLPTVKGPFLFPGYKQDKPMSTAGINKRVGELGRAVGIQNLSPHDLRHHRFDEEVREGTDMKTIQDMGGWSSPAMPMKYAIAGKIANAGASFFRKRNRDDLAPDRRHE